jgi:intracellular multiplication protein IcmD
MKKVVLWGLSLTCFATGSVALAASSGVGIGATAAAVTSNLANVAKLITAASYVAGMAFAVGAIVKFKGHKDNPAQVPLGGPIVMLFVGAALIFIPSVYKVSGSTLFGGSGAVAGVSGVTSFGMKH